MPQRRSLLSERARTTLFSNTLSIFPIFFSGFADVAFGLPSASKSGVWQLGLPFL
jgi:hypothetical protein